LFLFAYFFAQAVAKTCFYGELAGGKFFITALLIFELEIDLLNHDVAGFSEKFLIGFASHFDRY
jgi:hypothetical protein